MHDLIAMNYAPLENIELAKEVEATTGKESEPIAARGERPRPQSIETSKIAGTEGRWILVFALHTNATRISPALLHNMACLGTD